MLLGLDLGTTNVKALVTDSAGKTLAQASCPVELFHIGEGGVEQDIEEIWNATLSAIRQVARAVNPAGLHAVGISSQGGAMQVLDANGQPVGHVVSWLDQRGRADDEALGAELRREWFVGRTGHRGSGLAIGQVLRLRRESPGLLAAPNRVGFVGDIIVSRLCGRAAHDGTSCSLTLLYNPTARNYDPDVLRRLGLSAEQLPDLLSPRQAAGGLTAEVARDTGLTAGIPVSTAVHDQYAAALGSGAVQAGTVMIGAGTAWVVLAVSSRPTVPVTDNAFACHHVVDGMHGQILSLVNGGSALRWTLELMGLGGSSSAEIEQLLTSSPASSAGLRFWPFLAASAPAEVKPGTKGQLAGVQFSHRPAHVARAVVEGLVFELQRHLLLVRRAGIPVEKLVMGGVTAASRVTPQIIADVTGLPLACCSAEAGSPLGAAVLARGLLEPKRSLAELAREMAAATREVRPGTDAALYAERFEEYLRSLPLAQENPP